MALFISYSSQDRSTVDALTTALRRGQNQVWFDQELGGGDSWWAKILEQIRDCEVFIVALSSNWLQSKPSQAELRYAQALGRPILPVRIGEVDSMRVNPLAALQIIDYREPTVDAGIQLVTAVHALRSKPVPLPDPLPEEPPVPFGYITRLGNTLAEKELSPQQQLQLLVELRSGFDEDGDDPSARGDIAQLLRMLRLRHDVTYRTRSEIDNVLAEIEAKDGSPGGAAKAAAPAAAAASTPAAAPSGANAVTVPTAVSGGAAGGGGSNKRLLIIGGAAGAVIAAIAIVVVMTTQSSKPKPAPQASNSNSAPATPNSAPNPGSAKLDSFLIGAPEVGAIVGDPTLVPGEKVSGLRSPKYTLSDPECAGAFEPTIAAVYQDAGGFTATSTLVVHSPGQDPPLRIIEAVSEFSSSEKASAFVAASADKWKACAGKTVTEKLNGKSFDYTFAQVDGTVPRIAMQRTRSDNAKTCHHVLHAEGANVIEVNVCGPDAAPGQAGKIAEQIAKKVDD
ncbi:TIR domain-containing protein [Mycobacterium ahvazicum]|uniref:TIR domain-containing protein n=1 Tax=Mycobacterium ahvazicum TaxID=1964395 RepID=A0A2K4YH40_9MYCO|nr:sensor domain-containing protein [Mycobacterium ahvazicum]SOX56099.1 TIR domain-containing protein [Mycobacterium ahvazicum]